MPSPLPGPEDLGVHRIIRRSAYLAQRTTSGDVERPTTMLVQSTTRST